MPVAGMTTSTLATLALQDPLSRTIFVGIVPTKLNTYFRKGPGNQLLFGKILQPLAHCGYSVV